MNRNLLAGSLLLGAMAAASLAQAQPAQAFTFDQSAGTLTLDLSPGGDGVGTEFKILFNGLVEEQVVPGLQSEALFKIIQQDANPNTLEFEVELTNTSTNGITSRVSILGFDLSPNPDSVTSTGIFNSVASGNPPGNAVGPVEFCFGDGNNNCQGGAGGGVTTGNTGTFFPTFTFNSGIPTQLTFSNFFVRYQEINGTNLGNSGVGVGQVPTPALLPGLLGMGVVALRKKKEEEEDAVETKKVKQAV